jgi:hypothetical protein
MGKMQLNYKEIGIRLQAKGLQEKTRKYGRRGRKYHCSNVTGTTSYQETLK